MTIQTIIFDFGNVLAFFDHRRALRRLLPFTDQTPEHLLRIIYEENLQVRYECGQLSTQELYEIARSQAGLQCSPDQFVDAFSDIFSPNPPMAGLLPLLRQAGYRLLLASNTNPAHADRFRREFSHLLDELHFIGLSHEAGARKPDHAFFRYVHNQALCEPDRCLFIDDVVTNVEGARAFGWQTILYRDHDQFIGELQRLGIAVP